MFISKPHTRARQSSAISDHFPSQAHHGRDEQMFGGNQQNPTRGAKRLRSVKRALLVHSPVPRTSGWVRHQDWASDLWDIPMRKVLTISRAAGIWAFGLAASAAVGGLAGYGLVAYALLHFSPTMHLPPDTAQAGAIAAMCAFACLRLWAGEARAAAGFFVLTQCRERPER
jgi:hypothetical protein